MRITRRRWIVFLALVAAVLAPRVGRAQPSAKNVILMISDGQGFNTVKATQFYTGTRAVYEDFDIRVSMQTHSASNPSGYDPQRMATDFDYAKRGATDSASAATAMYTGVKVLDNRINMSPSGEALTTIFEQLAGQGKSIGAVSSVQLSHATPGAVYGHNASRNNYAEIAKEAVYGRFPAENNTWYDAADYQGNLKVIMGAGHPDYDNNGALKLSVTDKFVGGEQAWSDLGNGVNGWTRIDAKEQFEALAAGESLPDKVFGVARVNETLQLKRTAGSGMNDNVPSLAIMSLAALNVLAQNSSGFAVMIEGGAVDWANHDNNLARMIEEQIDFNHSVQAVVEWVETHSSWQETLLIVTADHECGHLWGDGTGSGFFDVDGNGEFTLGTDYGHLADHGVGVLPGAQYFSGSHTNVLVPLYAKGVGSELFLERIIGSDPNLAGYYGLDATIWTGQYIDNTAVFHVMNDVTTVPEPASILMLGAGAAGLVLAGSRRARRRLSAK